MTAGGREFQVATCRRSAAEGSFADVCAVRLN